MDSLRETLALTIAVVGAVESMFRSIGRPYPEQWESMERSAETFTDQHVVKWMANADPELKKSITKQRRRKLTAKAGALQLVESDRTKQTRWPESRSLVMHRFRSRSRGGEAQRENVRLRNVSMRTSVRSM